jgi:hypothetical protein
LLYCHWRTLFSFEGLANEEMLIVHGLSGTQAGEGIPGGDMDELTVFPLGPGNGEETERVAPGPSR